MSGNVGIGIALRDSCAQCCKALVLRILKNIAFQSFKLNANGVVIAIVLASIA